MEKITLGEITKWLGFILTFGGSVSALLVGIKNIFNKQLKPLNDIIKELDINQCRNYLVDFLADIENGIIKNDGQIKRAYEVYDHYTNDLHKNSYVRDKWEKLKEAGKL